MEQDTMEAPLAFWMRRIGVWLAPDATDPLDALMRPYRHAQKQLSTRIGGSEPGRFLVSEERAALWAPIAAPAGGHEIEVYTTASMRRRDWLIDIILNPPRPPFLAASIGMSGADATAWRISVSQEAIVFGGAASMLDGVNTRLIERPRFMDAMAWLRETGIPAQDVLWEEELRRRFRMGLIDGPTAKRRIAAIKSDPELRKTAPPGIGAFELRLAQDAVNRQKIEEGDGR